MASVSKRKWIHNGKEREAWVVRYVDKGGKHRSRQFAKKKEADDAKRKVEGELESGTHVARRDSRTLADLIAEFVADVERRVEDGKCGRGYLDMAKHGLKYPGDVMGNVLVRDLTWQQVEQFAIGLRTTVSRYKRPLTRRHISNLVSLLGTVIGYAVRRGYCARNVVPDALRELGSATNDRIETFTQGEVRSLFVALETRRFRREVRTYVQMKAMVYLAALCGLRKGEICALRWDHIDFAAMRICVRQSLDNYDKVKGPKTKAGIRDVPMPRMVADVLREYHPFVGPEPRKLIFRTKRGGIIHNVGFYKLWYPLLEQAGMMADDRGKHRHFHALRHFAGSAWLQAGMALPEVSRLLGHANTQITAEIYAHAITESHHRAPEIDACADLIAPAALLLSKSSAQELRNGF